MELFDEINTLDYIFLIDITEPGNNQLSIKIREASISNDMEHLIIGKHDFGLVQSVNNSDGKEYQLYFKSYTAYAVFNESYVTNDDSEIGEGKLFCIYSRSAYLDYVQAATFIEAVYEGKKLKHFQINCQNHIISVAAMDEPFVKKIPYE